MVLGNSPIHAGMAHNSHIMKFMEYRHIKNQTSLLKDEFVKI